MASPDQGEASWPGPLATREFAAGGRGRDDRGRTSCSTRGTRGRGRSLRLQRPRSHVRRVCQVEHLREVTATIRLCVRSGVEAATTPPAHTPRDVEAGKAPTTRPTAPDPINPRPVVLQPHTCLLRGTRARALLAAPAVFAGAD